MSNTMSNTMSTYWRGKAVQEGESMRMTVIDTVFEAHILSGASRKAAREAAGIAIESSTARFSRVFDESVKLGVGKDHAYAAAKLAAATAPF